MWEYTNMIFLFITAEDSTRFSRERGKIAELNAFHEKFNTLPMSEEKTFVSLFRTAMICDTNVEEFLRLQEKLPNQVIIQDKVSTDNAMEILEDINLRSLYIDQTEKFMDEYVGTALEMKGLFKTHDSNAALENIQQMVCGTAKEWFEKHEDEISLFGLQFTKDEQLSFWHSRTEETWRKKTMPLMIEGYIKLNDNKTQFNFLRSLDIENINREFVNLHPSTHEFWEDENIKLEFMEFLGKFAKNKLAYNKMTSKEQAEQGANILRGEFDDVEVGFVDGLFEMYKIRE